MKALSPTLSTILSGEFIFIHLVTLRVASTTVYLTDNDVDYEHEGQMYLSGVLKNGQKFSFETDGDLDQEDNSFELVDTDNSLTALILNDGISDSSVKIERLYISSQQGFSEVSGRWQGTIEKPEEEADIVKISATSLRRLRSDINCIRTNNASQQRFHPNDECFEQTPFAQRDIPWMQPVSVPIAGNVETDYPYPTEEK